MFNAETISTFWVGSHRILWEEIKHSAITQVVRYFPKLQQQPALHEEGKGEQT